jgi:hypothetical protein
MVGQRATANLAQGRRLRVGGETGAEVVRQTEKERETPPRVLTVAILPWWWELGGHR